MTRRPSAFILKKNYNTVIASNGLEAIEGNNQAKPDLILMGVKMPIMDGFEARKKSRNRAKTHSPPITFITSKGDLQSMKIGLRAGVKDYLTKPFEPEELLARIQAVLHTQKLYNQLMEAYSIIDQERDTIARIQKSLICKELPNIPGFNFFADYQPSSKASGDYYDFIRIDEDHLGVLVADVSGHGTSAAVIMAMMRVLIRSFLAKVSSPERSAGNYQHHPLRKSGIRTLHHGFLWSHPPPQPKNEVCFGRAQSAFAHRIRGRHDSKSSYRKRVPAHDPLS